MGKIRDIHGLELEIERTKRRLERIEDRLDHNLEDLKTNYWLMVINSFIGPERKEKIMGFAEGLLRRIWKRFS